jgi:D-tyrosyl-tRNA(Tyr) deacylase
MRALIQRVSEASVSVESRRVAGIGKGMLVFVGIGKDDSEDDLRYVARKVRNLRIFEDEQGKMNLNVIQAGGSILSVSQFTLYADTTKGNRPGFDRSAPPDIAKGLWKKFNEFLVEEGLDVSAGVFGSHMDVSLVNDGPVTIWIDSKRNQ